MAEHSEAPKNPQNPTEKSGSEYQPLWDMEQPAPDYSALLLHGTPVPAPTGEIPEPVREVLEIQKARSASAPADSAVPAAPDSAVPALAVSAPAPSVPAANFFPSAEGYPVLNRPLYGRRAHDAPNVPHGHGYWRICKPAGAKCVSYLAGGESSGYTATHRVYLSDPTCGQGACIRLMVESLA